MVPEYIPFPDTPDLLSDVVFGLTFEPSITLAAFITRTFESSWQPRFQVYTELFVTMNPQIKEYLINYWNAGVVGE